MYNKKKKKTKVENGFSATMCRLPVGIPSR